MHKTVAEAEEFIQALLPRVSDAEGVDVAVCAPFTALQAVRRLDARLARRGLRAEHAPGGRGRVHRRGRGADARPSSASTASCSATPSAASTSARPTARSPRRSPAALGAGLRPILCVGETEEERERGDTERKLRHQVQAGLEKLRDERLGDVVIAYEPIWAIGTGLVATPEQAQEAIAFVRALVADRDREQAERTRILYGGSVKPDNAAELLALPDVDGALVGGASLEVDSFAAIVDAAVQAVRS